MARVLSVTSVRISLQKSNPPTILVEATGKVGTPGWKNIDLVSIEDKLSDDGILDLELSGNPPSRDVLLPQVIRDVTGDFVITKDVERIVGVVVHARTNTMTALIGGASEPGPDAFTPMPGLPGLPAPGPGPAQPPLNKTFAISEEGPIKTVLLAEDGPMWHKTWLISEEGTFAQGETPPTPLWVEVRKPWQADDRWVVDRQFPPDPGPLMPAFGSR